MLSVLPDVPPDAADAPARMSWRALLARRARHRFLLKFAGVSAFIWLFFLAYFELLRNPSGPVLVMPLTALDAAIPVQPAALLAYVSLWLYVGIPAGLMASVRQLVVYGLWAAVLCLLGLACFWAWPTAVPVQALPVDLASHPGFALLQGLDAAGNACPSLHVATAVFSAVWIARLLRGVAAPIWPQALNLLWLLLIVYSTLAIKQHVVLDVLAGTLLALAVAVPSLRWFPWAAR